MVSMGISPSVFRRSTQSITWNECWALSGSAMMPSSRCGRKVHRLWGSALHREQAPPVGEKRLQIRARVPQLPWWPSEKRAPVTLDRATWVPLEKMRHP
jgi:hypothetical protein